MMLMAFGSPSLRSISSASTTPSSSAGRPSSLLLAEVGEDVVTASPCTGRPMPTLIPDNLAAAEFLRQRAQAVVPAVPAPLLELDPSKRDVEIVVDDDEILKGELVEAERVGLTERPDRFMKVCGLRRNSRSPAQFPSPERPEKVLLVTGIPALRERRSKTMKPALWRVHEVLWSRDCRARR